MRYETGRWGQSGGREGKKSGRRYKHRALYLRYCRTTSVRNIVPPTPVHSSILFKLTNDRSSKWNKLLQITPVFFLSYLVQRHQCVFGFYIYTLLATRHLSPPHMFYLNNCLRPREVKLFNVTWKWIISQHPQMNVDLVQQQQWNETSTSTNNSRNTFATQHLNIVTFRLFTCICKHTLMVPRSSSGGVWTSVSCSGILSHAVVGELNQRPSYCWTSCSTKLICWTTTYMFKLCIYLCSISNFMFEKTLSLCSGSVQAQNPSEKSSLL